MFVLYHRRTFRTGRALANALGWGGGRTLDYPLGSRARFIRWGNSQRPEVDENYIPLNKASAINLAGDKFRSLQKLEEAGLSVPSFTQNLNHVDTGGAVWLGRSRRGFGGRDIVVQPGPTECEWYSRYIPNNREYRIHIVNGEVIRLQRKYLDHPEMRSNEYVCSHSNGYVFRRPELNLNQNRYDDAIAAVAALGLDFGAVDMIIDPEGKHYILEVNTAPGCSPLTLTAYVNAFKELDGRTST